MADDLLSGGVDQTAEVNTAVVENTPDSAVDKAVDSVNIIGENGDFAENWRDSLPEELRGEKCLENVKNLSGLVKSFVSGQKMIGAKGVVIPGENATAEELDSFYKACGRPDKAADYSIEGIELPEGIELDEAATAQFREAAFGMGLSQKAFAEALKFDVNRAHQAAVDSANAIAQERSDTEARLKSEFGSSYGDNIAAAKLALDKLGLTELSDSKCLGNNYAFIKALVTVGKSLGESVAPGGGPAKVDPAARLAEITGNLEDPYHQVGHPQHAARVKEVEALVRAMAQA